MERNRNRNFRNFRNHYFFLKKSFFICDWCFICLFWLACWCWTLERHIRYPKESKFVLKATFHFHISHYIFEHIGIHFASEEFLELVELIWIRRDSLLIFRASCLTKFCEMTVTLSVANWRLLGNMVAIGGPKKSDHWIIMMYTLVIIGSHWCKNWYRVITWSTTTVRV